MMSTYQKLHDGIFIGGATDIEELVSHEGCNVIIDLRSEASEPSTKKEDASAHCRR
jgi:hypothetical protein